MKVAICVTLDLSAPGGVEAHILQLSHALREIGLQVDIFSTHCSADIKSLSSFHPEKYHILHTHAAAFPSRLWSFFLNRNSLPRHIHTLHGVSLEYLFACRTWLNWRCYWGTFMEGLLSHLADHVIAVSQSVKNRALQCHFAPSPKITIIPNGYTPVQLSPQTRADVRSRLGLSSDELVLLFVGRGEDRLKGTQTITDSLNQLYRQYPHLRLLAIPGTGFSPAPWLCTTGPIPYDQMSEYYTAADIYLNASLLEGMPLTIVEALAAGLPVIAAPVGGIPDIITPDHSGILLSPDRSDLTAQITRLIENPTLRQTLTQNAPTAVHDLTWPTLAQQTFSIYQSIIPC